MCATSVPTNASVQNVTCVSYGVTELSFLEWFRRVARTLYIKKDALGSAIVRKCIRCERDLKTNV